MISPDPAADLSLKSKKLTLDYGGRPPEKPVALSLEAGNIPSELKERKQWVLWRYQWNQTRWTKVPFQPNGQTAKSNDPTTWHSWESCVAAYHDGFLEFDGIMFALAADDPYTFIDLDHCADSQDVEPWANAIIGQFVSYTEKALPIPASISWSKVSSPPVVTMTKDKAWKSTTKAVSQP